MKKDVVTSEAFTSDVKLTQRYAEMLSRSTLYLADYLLDIMSIEQVETQVKNTGKLVSLIPPTYARHFSPNFLAHYFASIVVKSGIVKRPENWVDIPANKRFKLFNIIADSVAMFRTISKQLLKSAADVCTQLPDLESLQ